MGREAVDTILARQRCALLVYHPRLSASGGSSLGAGRLPIPETGTSARKDALKQLLPGEVLKKGITISALGQSIAGKRVDAIEAQQSSTTRISIRAPPLSLYADAILPSNQPLLIALDSLATHASY